MNRQASITCGDGTRITGQWHRARTTPKATVVVAPGAAAEARFYVPFCEHLAETGHDALVFDFRTVGESGTDRRRRRECGFSTWIEQDYPAVIAHAHEHARHGPMIVIGHSAGGWMAGVQPAADRIDALIGVAALSGHWRHMARPHRYAHWLAWHALVPASCRLLGTWPGFIGFRRNMGPRFGLEFSRWARRRDFVFSEPAFDANAWRFRGHLHLFQISDDPWGTQAAVADFGARFPNASGCVVETIRNDAENPEPIGHFGVFRKSRAQTLWPRLVDAIAACRDAVREH